MKNILFEVQKKQGIVGREQEIELLSIALQAGRNILVEGPVGVGKTVLAQAVASVLGKKVIRIDGDSRFSEQKLTGWFDPALAIKKGYSKKTFVLGPLAIAMHQGAILFINELNRMPEAVQNVLLPAMDEGMLLIPQLGEIHAKEGFLVIATQNPREFVATSHLSEALLDRMEWVRLDYQSFEEELEIVKYVTKYSERERDVSATKYNAEAFLSWAVSLVRLTRSHPKIKRGASIRAAIALIQILSKKSNPSEKDFLNAASLALPSRIELLQADLEGGISQAIESLILELIDELKKKETILQSIPMTH